MKFKKNAVDNLNVEKSVNIKEIQEVNISTITNFISVNLV